MRSIFINNATKVIFCSLLWVSCQSDQKSLLCKKWKSVELKNPKMENEIASMKTYIDTIGNQDEALRKQVNIDSLKGILKNELDNAIREQQISLENTLMEFKQDGKVFTTSGQRLDSAMYRIDDKNTIVIKETDVNNNSDSMKFTIVKLTKDSLQLKMEESGETSYVTMIPFK